jgi:Domain of unknown function (DUF4169)
MGDIVNLRQHRKRKARARKGEAAAENRARFGMTRAERERNAATQTKEQRNLDGHRRDPVHDEEP